MNEQMNNQRNEWRNELIGEWMSNGLINCYYCSWFWIDFLSVGVGVFSIYLVSYRYHQNLKLINCSEIVLA